MDPNIMKLLEEDEDESMHSGADVDAFTAQLNRHIEAASSYQSHHSNAALSQGSNQRASQFLPPWQLSALDGNVNFQSGRDLLVRTDQHSSRLELQQQGPGPFNPKGEDGFSKDLTSHHFPITSSEFGFPIPNAQDDQKTFHVSHPMSSQISRSQPVVMRNLDHEPKPEVDTQMQTLQNMCDQQAMPMGSNNQQSMGMELNDQQSLSTGSGNDQAIMGNGNNQDVKTMNQQSTGIGMNGQRQSVMPGMRNQESMIGSFAQPGTSIRNKQVPFGMLLPLIQPHLDKDRSMQLNTLYAKLKKNEITKDDFVRHMRNIVGDQMLKMAVIKLQTQTSKQKAPGQFLSQNQPPGRQVQVSSTVQMQTNLTNLARDSNPCVVDNKADVPRVQVSQMATSGFGAVSQERKHPVFPLGTNKQHVHFSQTSFPAYGSSGSSYQPFSSISTSIRPQTTAHQSTTPVKQETVDQSREHQKAQLLSTHAQSSMPLIKQGNAAPGNSIGESFEVNASKALFPPPAYMMAPPIPPTGPSKAPPRKPAVGQKKQMEAPGSSPPSSKKQKVSGGSLDESIEQLNDVTAVSGVNLREEEEHMLSGSKEGSRILEISRRVVQEEEEKLILQKVPLQKKVAEIMAKSGVKSMGAGVERCLSLCVEERMRGLIFNLIRLSKQRVDMEKPRHRTIITSDIRQQILTINHKAREELEKKQAEIEKSLKPTDSEGGATGDGDEEKDESRLKSAKVNKEEDDKMRAEVTTKAVRAATGTGDMFSRWQLMAEANQKQGVTDTVPSASQPGKDVARKTSQASTKNTREGQGEKRETSAPFSTPASGRKVGRNQVAARPVARSITVKDVIALLEREPQMSKSMFLYRLYERAC